MPIVTMKALLENGVHFGHRTHRWHPKMKPYIFTERNNIHIIDLEQTLKQLERSYALVRDIVADGGSVLFVGTKRQAQDIIIQEATRCGMPHVTHRWLGGTLTNWSTIHQRVNELKRLERMRDQGEFDVLTKKEALEQNRKIERLELLFGGIREMDNLPDVLFVVDVNREDTAVHEANLLGIPVIAMVDTNSDPRNIDYVIPSNDDAIRAIKLIVSKIADAVLEGKAMRKDEEEEIPEAVAIPYSETAEMSDDELLGASTLAKLEEQRAKDAAAQAEVQKANETDEAASNGDASEAKGGEEAGAETTTEETSQDEE